MDYIQITKDNIEKEHICCAMSGKQSVMKRNGLSSALQKVWFSTGARSAANALSSTSRQKTHGPNSGGTDMFISIVCGYPVP